MPELPEVETVARGLKKKILGQSINHILILDRKLKNRALSTLRNLSVKDVFRHGKQVALALSDRSYLLIHLRMTGNLIWAKNSREKSKRNLGGVILKQTKFSENLKSTRVVIVTEKGNVHFTDTRRFGTIELRRSLPATGIDPLSSAFDAQGLKQLLLSTNQPLKSFLMRQDKIVGIGNIYASEILFRAKINPRRKTLSLKNVEIKLLAKEIKKVLTQAIQCCGTTFSDYHGIDGDA
ncbi:hypothetical protein JNK13_06365, partial [bacterium]|nr:hypothetical protein [bacterium]